MIFLHSLQRAAVGGIPSLLLLAASGQAPADVNLLATACNQFAVDLHATLAAKGSPTAAPGSIALALLMVVPGARGATEQELIRALHLPDQLRGERLHQAAKALIADVAIAKTGKPDTERPQLRITNDLWTQSGYPILDDYSNLLRTCYGAQQHEVPFATDPEGARTKINAYIAELTNQRIPELLPADLITPSVCVVLTNAIWLKAAWRHAFHAQATKPAPFTLGDGTTVDVPTMHRTESFAWGECDAWQCVVLPFANCDVVAEFVLPRPGKSLGDAEHALLAGEHANLLTEERVAVRLPKFCTIGKHSLREALIALGVVEAFDWRADFTGMTPKRELMIFDVVHQTWIQVDEAGAEATAATAVVLGKSAAGRPGQLKVFAADRPFAFTLRDRSTGLVLFAARVADPRANASSATEAR